MKKNTLVLLGVLGVVANGMAQNFGSMAMSYNNQAQQMPYYAGQQYVTAGGVAPVGEIPVGQSAGMISGAAGQGCGDRFGNTALPPGAMSVGGSGRHGG